MRRDGPVKGPAKSVLAQIFLSATLAAFAQSKEAAFALGNPQIKTAAETTPASLRVMLLPQTVYRLWRPHDILERFELAHLFCTID
jgi:hypothetical protein